MSVVTTGITKVDFAVLDNRVVPVGNVDGSVRPLLDIDRAKRDVLRTDQVGLLPGGKPRSVFTQHKPTDTMTTEIMGDQISLPVIREMSSIDHFQAAILGASWIQSMQNARHTKDRRIGCPRNDVIDSLAPGTIGHKRLSPAIKSVTPSVDPAPSENIEFHRFWTEPPDSPGIQSANAEGGLDMAVNVDRLIHVELAIHPPAKRVQDVVGVFGTEPAQHNPRLIGFAVGKITSTFAAPLFPKYVLLLPLDSVAGFLAVLAICMLASLVAIRMALKVDPAEAIG